MQNKKRSSPSESAKCTKDYKHVPNRVKNIYIEGCIGEGKSTLCIALKKRLESTGTVDVIYCTEEVDPVLLDLFYKKPKEMEKFFQSQMITSRISQKIKTAQEVKRLLKESDRDIYVINDAGYLTDEAFIRANLESDYLTESESEFLFSQKRHLEDSVKWAIIKPDYVFLLSSNTGKCLANIKQRARKSEVEISATYISTLIAVYRKIFEKQTLERDVTKFHLVDTSKNFADVDTVLGVMSPVTADI